jgi:hypothetical protein
MVSGKKDLCKVAIVKHFLWLRIDNYLQLPGSMQNLDMETKPSSSPDVPFVRAFFLVLLFKVCCPRGHQENHRHLASTPGYPNRIKVEEFGFHFKMQKLLRLIRF